MSPACSLGVISSETVVTVLITFLPFKFSKSRTTSFCARLKSQHRVLDFAQIKKDETMEGKGTRTAPRTCLTKFVDPLSEESHRYFLARRNALEMLRDRGYDVSAEDINLSLQDFRAVYGQHPDVNRLRISAQLRSDSTKKVKVVFCGTGMVKVNAIRSIAADVLSQETITGLILVLQSHVTNQALKAIELFSFKVEVFQITDLLVNFTKHVLKPQHRVLNDNEKTTLLKKFNIEEKQLPRISKKDAIVRYYGLEKGQVVKVNYRGELTESHVAYRCVW